MDSHAAIVWRIADYSTVFLTIYRQRQRYCLRRCVYSPTVVISEWQSVSGQLSIDGWVPCWSLDNCFETFWTRNLLAEQMLEFHSCCKKNGRLFCKILDKKLTFWADGWVPRRMADCFVTFWTRSLLSEQMVESHGCRMQNVGLPCNILDGILEASVRSYL